MNADPSTRPLTYEPDVHVGRLVRAALDAADPGEALRRHFPRELLGSRCAVVAAGKASARMLGAMIESKFVALDRAICVGPPGTASAFYGGHAIVEAYDADHPLPTARNTFAAERVRAFVEQTVDEHSRPDDTALVVLLSGGASSLLTLAVDEVGIEDVRAITNALLRGGATIHELNCVRKHIDVFKGGGLARLAYPVPNWTMILSDVIGDDLSSIASGPTYGDPTTFADAVAVIDKYDARSVSDAIARYLDEGANGEHPETMKPRDPALERAEHRIVGNNMMAVEAVVCEAARLGFECVAVRNGVEGEAREVGRMMASEAKRLLATSKRPACIVAGGETTVTVRGRGKGGRNQELALAAAIDIADAGRVVVASFSTDGVDGFTDAGGATATEQSVRAARAGGVDAVSCLDDNDSHRFFEAAGGLIKTGPTGTNVNDIAVALVYPGQRNT